MPSTAGVGLGAGNEHNTDFDAWLKRLIKDRSASEQDALMRACDIAKQGVKNKLDAAEGKNFVKRLCMVVNILVDLRMDTDTLVAAMLRHMLRDGLITPGSIRKKFGEKVAHLVEGVTKMEVIDELDLPSGSVPSPVNSIKLKASQTESLRKMLLAMVEDVRVMLIKLAERLYDMRTLPELPAEVQSRIARETLEIFAPLANRLGIWQIKWELEDLAMRCLDPETYQRIAKLLEERRADREEYIQKVVGILQNDLKQTGIKAKVYGRAKHIYSIWRKMQRKGLDFHQVFDTLAVRVLVNTVTECYAVLGVIHNKWYPIHGEFDDYIAAPKSNAYKSLHTAVVGLDRKIFEVQIRTKEMHRHAELGVASHWRYKEGGKHDKGFEQKVAWLRQIIEWKDEAGNAGDFIDRFKSELFEDRVYALSPQGKIVDLPQGATPLDFAYYIHTSLGHRCRGAKVNSRIVPLNYVLKNGEQVEILATKQEHPNREWLSRQLGYLKTSRARAKVKSWLRQQDMGQHIAEGRTILGREFRRLNLANYDMGELAKRFHFNMADDFMAAVGRGDIATPQIANIVKERVLSGKRPRIARRAAKRDDDMGGQIAVHGIGGLLAHAAGCCEPVPNDPVVGYVTREHGVTVHRSDCQNVLRWQGESNERLIEVSWNAPAEMVYPVNIYIEAFDRIGLLRDITDVFSDEKLNIVAVNTNTDKNNVTRMNIAMEITDIGQLSRALAKVDLLPNVMDVMRKR
ncbi:MAG: bifunctional (p)ppGpp synthetase/guanosine-3',5'-bis(diphosphate) 3'-pyrophosphohydrolase [Gammaproteobacteria bacterium]|nr:bifunctional (p)ppGpp synthetase/guanosine-3',5'-bis(diphosphate) 3'-pyrophosphohydrolase [Gammaproteobacteria bacterium]